MGILRRRSAAADTDPRRVGILRRRSAAADTDVATLLLQGHDMIRQTGQAHAERWGLGTADQWDLDQAEGLLRWSFPSHTAQAPAQFLGTFSPTAGSWMWAWANDSFVPGMRVASEQVRRWGADHRQAMLTTASLEVDADQAADLAALGFRLSGATGYYRASAGPSQVHLVFGPVTIVSADGDAETFTIDVE